MERASAHSLQTRSVIVDDAEIVYDYEGTGPILLTIAARGGTGGRYAGLAAILKTDYTVLRYDRRCCGRSTGDTSRPMDVMQQARDAVAVLRDTGAHDAFVLGNSAGATIALKLAEQFPEAVSGMIVHEPVTITILDDRADLIAFNRKADELYHREGAAAAGKLLATRMVGMAQGGPPSGARPAADNDADFFLKNEFMSLCYYWPDFDRIKRSGVKLSASKGALSGDAFYARSAAAVAAGLDCPLYTLSGNHIAYTSDPATFAAELRPILDELQHRRST